MEACEVALVNIIDSLDEDKDGKVQVRTFVKFMADYGILIHPEEILELDALSDDHNLLGKNALKNFIKKSWCWDNLKKHAVEIDGDYKRVTVAFNLFDKNHDKFVDKSEFGKALKNLKDEQINAVFNKFDEDDDGKLTLIEFRNFMNARKFRKSS